LGVALTGTLIGGLTGFVWGGLTRIFLQHHMTFSVNSIGHYFGKRPFQTADRSTNVAWLSIPSLGDSWHHNHHAFPRSARHGLRGLQLDLSYLSIKALEQVGLAWDLKQATPEEIATASAEEAKR
jgi:stearoyl-CoA desaturase (delta-9 desaturase)